MLCPAIIESSILSTKAIHFSLQSKTILISIFNYTERKKSIHKGKNEHRIEKLPVPIRHMYGPTNATVFFYKRVPARFVFLFYLSCF